MADEDDKPENGIGEHDIVFDCPRCAKNLAIDYRGAGLAIRCPACGEEIEVPIPDGVDIADIDRLGAVEVRGVGDIEESTRLPESPDEIRLLMTELAELRFRRRYLEKRQANVARELEAMQTQVDGMRITLDQVAESLKRLREPSSGETQDLT